MSLPAEYRPPLPPMRHQREALERSWSRPGYGYLMEMGLGKSRTLIDNFCLLYQRDECDALLVIAPKSVYTNWSRVSDVDPGELQKWLWPDVAAGQVVQTWRSSRRVPPHPDLLTRVTPGPRVLVVNVEALAAAKDALELCERFLVAHPKNMMAIDESIVMLDPNSKRTRMILGLRRRAKYRRILSGLPTKGKPTHLWAQFEFLEPGALGYRSFYAYRAAFCILRDVQAGGRTIRMEVGARNTEELAERVAEHAYRATKDECLDLPPKVYIVRDVELTPEQKSLYKELKATAMLDLGVNSMTTQNVVTQLLRLHQLVCGHVKYDSGETRPVPENRTRELLEVLRENENEQAIIWCTYQEDVRRIARILREGRDKSVVAEWHGSISERDREEGEQRFKAGVARYMLATQQAGARGRQWSCARLTVYYANNHDLELRRQSEDRPHRMGQLGTCVYVDLICRGTVDERIIEALRRNEDVVRTILRDGPRALTA